MQTYTHVDWNTYSIHDNGNEYEVWHHPSGKIIARCETLDDAHATAVTHKEQETTMQTRETKYGTIVRYEYETPTSKGDHWTEVQTPEEAATRIYLTRMFPATGVTAVQTGVDTFHVTSNEKPALTLTVRYA